MSTTGTDLVLENLIYCGIALIGFERSRRSLDARYWSLASGHWQLVTGYWLLASGCWILDARYWILVAGLWSLDTDRWSLVTGLWKLVVECSKINGIGSSRRVSAISLLYAMRYALCALLHHSAFPIPNSITSAISLLYAMCYALCALLHHSAFPIPNSTASVFCYSAISLLRFCT